MKLVDLVPLKEEEERGLSTEEKEFYLKSFLNNKYRNVDF